ncbi:MAG: response regulator [Bacteroidota bacterium]
MEKPLVLIVEDNKINALVLKKAIDKVCQPEHVINDQQTFSVTKERSFSLILMDINLGGNSMDGEAIMKELRADPRYEDTPIFAVTSYAMPGDKERFLEAGFDSYFSKPIDKTAILEGVQRILSALPSA